MITEKEFKEHFGFKPQQDDLDRVNCEKAGQVGHLMCGICERCRLPKFRCSCQQPNAFKRLGLELVGDELFALPDEQSEFPLIRAFMPTEMVSLGLRVDPKSVTIVRRRMLSRDAFDAIVDDSNVKKYLYQPLTDVTIDHIRATIGLAVMEEIRRGELFKTPDGTWRHQAEYWFGTLQSQEYSAYRKPGDRK